MLKSATFESKNKLNPAYVKKHLSENFNFGVVEQMDPTNFFGAGLLLTGSLSKTKQKISVGALIKVEMSPSTNFCKLSVKAVHENLSTSLFQSIKTFIRNAKPPTSDVDSLIM